MALCGHFPLGADRVSSVDRESPSLPGFCLTQATHCKGNHLAQSRLVMLSLCLRGMGGKRFLQDILFFPFLDKSLTSIPWGQELCRLCVVQSGSLIDRALGDLAFPTSRTFTLLSFQPYWFPSGPKMPAHCLPSGALFPSAKLFSRATACAWLLLSVSHVSAQMSPPQRIFP